MERVISDLLSDNTKLFKLLVDIVGTYMPSEIHYHVAAWTAILESKCLPSLAENNGAEIASSLEPLMPYDTHVYASYPYVWVVTHNAGCIFTSKYNVQTQEFSFSVEYQNALNNILKKYFGGE